MTISPTLQQIYFLGVRPEKQSEVAAHLLAGAGEKKRKEVGKWCLYARLARPGLIAMRSVSCTTGLDLFLLDPPREGKAKAAGAKTPPPRRPMEGVEDVAEIMGYGLNSEEGKTGHPTAEPRRAGHVPAFGSAWKDFEQRFTGPRAPKGCLFLTFLRLNWDVLMDHNLWQPQYGLAPPSRTQVLQAVARALTRAVARQPPNYRPLHFHLAGGTGDCDLFVTGLVNTRGSLDRFLLILAQLGTDSLAAEMGMPAAAVRKILTWHPIAAASTTELAVPWTLYEEVLKTTRKTVNQASAGSPPSKEWTPEETRLATKVDSYLANGLRAAVFLRRTRSFLSDVRREVMEISPKAWTLQVVIGDADMLLRRPEIAPGRAGKKTAQGKEDALSNLLLLLGRLDAKSLGDKDFPRRIAVVLSFDDQQREHGALTRGVLLAPISQKEPTKCPALPQGEESAENLSKLAGCLSEMLRSRRREEYRILERMVERAATLQRQGELSREMRTLARLTLQRLARFLKREDWVDADSDEDGDEDDPAGGSQGEQSQFSDRHDEAAQDRHQVVLSGMHLERTLSHHARGSVPLLLSTIAQARSTDHFGSETTLTSALGAPASSVARRLLGELKTLMQGECEEDEDWKTLREALQDMESPILYTSHDPDFALVFPLGMIRVPRWVIWYPTVSSSVLHEVGHAVFENGGVRTQADRIAWTGIHLLITKGGRQFDSASLEMKARQGLLGKARRIPPVPLNTVPAAIRWIVPLLEDRLQFLGRASSFKTHPEDWGGQLDEITAELFCHCYSYPRDADPDAPSTRHIHDVLEHIAPLAHRMSRTHRLLFITRELAVRIALRLMEADARQEDPWRLGAARLATLVSQQMEVYRKCLGDWLDSPSTQFKDRPKNQRLRQDVRDIYCQMLECPPPGSRKFEKVYNTPVGKAVQWGIFAALLASSRNVIAAAPNDPIWITQKLWQGILTTSRSADAAPAADKARETRILAALKEGRVPDEISEWPERLPRRLHACLRQRGESVFLPQRFALTLALADWMVVNDVAARQQDDAAPGGEATPPASAKG